MTVLSILKSKGGIPVIVNSMPDSLTSGYMVAVKTGARDEVPGTFGISHLLEHVVFRATKTKTSFQMSKEIEGAGGASNAFTSKEATAFFAITIKDTAKVAKDYVSDIVANPLIGKEDTELEKKIVLQEISMCENDPERYIHDLYDEVVWNGHRLSQSEAGDRESVEAFTNEDLRKYYGEKYGASNLIVSVSGNVTPEDAVKWTEENFDSMGSGKKNVREKPNVTNHVYKHFKKKVDHCYVGIGCATTGPKEPDAEAVRVLDTILGGGTSSRLFQKVREERALVYSIHSALIRYTDCQSFGAFMSSTDANVLKSLEATAKVYRELKENGLDEGELRKAKNILKGRYTMASESCMSMMYTNMTEYMRTGKVKTGEEVFRSIESVTEEDVMKAAEKVLDVKKFSVTMLSDDVPSMKGFSMDQLDF